MSKDIDRDKNFISRAVGSASRETKARRTEKNFKRA
jgi:hypothetical protein